MLPWGKYEYLKLPVGLFYDPYIFQEKMNELYHVRPCINDLLVISNGNIEDHLNKPKIVSKKLKEFGFKINADKSIVSNIVILK